MQSIDRDQLALVTGGNFLGGLQQFLGFLQSQPFQQFIGSLQGLFSSLGQGAAPAGAAPGGAAGANPAAGTAPTGANPAQQTAPAGQ
jgi:hypothetical protein